MERAANRWDVVEAEKWLKVVGVSHMCFGEPVHETWSLYMDRDARNRVTCAAVATVKYKRVDAAASERSTQKVWRIGTQRTGLGVVGDRGRIRPWATRSTSSCLVASDLQDALCRSLCFTLVSSKNRNTCPTTFHGGI